MCVGVRDREKEMEREGVKPDYIKERQLALVIYIKNKILFNLTKEFRREDIRPSFVDRYSSLKTLITSSKLTGKEIKSKRCGFSSTPLGFTIGLDSCCDYSL